MGCEGMKQHISIENLQELSPEQQEKLREWWSIHQQQGDVFICLGNDFLSGKTFAWDGHNKPFNLAVPLLSIGQMIELLQENDGLDTCVYLDGSSIIEDANICDLLWDAVKSTVLHIDTEEEIAEKAKQERLAYMRHCKNCFRVFNLRDYDFSGGHKCPHCGAGFV